MIINDCFLLWKVTFGRNQELNSTVFLQKYYLPKISKDFELTN